MTDKAGIEDWELLAQLSQSYRGLSDAFMEEIELHRAQAILLCRLFEQNGMTQSEIAEQLSVQGATVTNMLKRMEEAGLVRRERDHEDNRLVRVYLTDEGRQKERAIVSQFVKVEETIFGGFTEQERILLRRLLGQMLANMNREI